MRYSVSEKKLGVAVFSFVLGIYIIAKATLFATPVTVSEKGLLLVMLAIELIIGSVLVAVRSVRKT
jgi:Na+/proline symporter